MPTDNDTADNGQYQAQSQTAQMGQVEQDEQNQDTAGEFMSNMIRFFGKDDKEKSLFEINAKTDDIESLSYIIKEIMRENPEYDSAVSEKAVIYTGKESGLMMEHKNLVNDDFNPLKGKGWEFTAETFYFNDPEFKKQRENLAKERGINLGDDNAQTQEQSQEQENSQQNSQENFQAQEPNSKTQEEFKAKSTNSQEQTNSKSEEKKPSWEFNGTYEDYKKQFHNNANEFLQSAKARRKMFDNAFEKAETLRKHIKPNQELNELLHKRGDFVSNSSALHGTKYYGSKAINATKDFINNKIEKSRELTQGTIRERKDVSDCNAEIRANAEKLTNPKDFEDFAKGLLGIIDAKAKKRYFNASLEDKESEIKNSFNERKKVEKLMKALPESYRLLLNTATKHFSEFDALHQEDKKEYTLYQNLNKAMERNMPKRVVDILSIIGRDCPNFAKSYKNTLNKAYEFAQSAQQANKKQHNNAQSQSRAM